MRGLLLSGIMAFTAWAMADGCPGADDEPALKVKTKAGPTLSLCGFEDHEIKAPEKGRRAFSEFTVYAWSPGAKEGKQLYISEGGDTHWAREADGGLRLEELWFFADKPHAAIARTLGCDASGCQVTSTKCVLNIKKNPFPKSLGTLERRLQSKKPVGEDAEELIDEVWAQALTGDKKAIAFLEAAPPAGLDSTLREVFEGNRQKLKQAHELKCQTPK